MRDRIRQWLGLERDRASLAVAIDGLSKQMLKIHAQQAEIRRDIAAHRNASAVLVGAQDEAQKHRNEELLGYLNAITMLLQQVHIPGRQTGLQSAEYDWDTVQAMALQQLLQGDKDGKGSN